MPETALRIARHAREWGRRSGRTCPCACTSWLRTQPEIRTCHTDKCARKGSVQTTVFISRGRNGGAGREGARVPLQGHGWGRPSLCGVKWWGWGWSRFRLCDSSEVPGARAARGESQTADCEPTSVFSHYSTIEIYNTSAQWRQVCRGRRRGGAQAAATPRRAHIPPGRAAEWRMPYAESCYPVHPVLHPAAYRVRTQYSGQKERIKHPGGAGEDPLVKALEPPTPQHPPAPLTRLPNTIPP